MSKRLKFRSSARESLKKGIDTLANAVEVTLGPKGRNVLLNKKTPSIINDGVTIAREINLENKFENAGAQVIKEAASKTNDEAGDGTTTAIVLAQSIFDKGLKYIVAGANPIYIRKGIEKATEIVIKKLKDMAQPINNKAEVKQIATISSGDDKVGEIIAEAVDKVKDNGVIMVEESQIAGLSLNMSEGMQVDSGYITPYMITNPDKMEAIVDNPYILVTDHELSSTDQLIPVLEEFNKRGKKELVIFADEFAGEALPTLIVNRLKGLLKVIAIKAPFHGGKKEILEDIAIVTGANPIMKDLNMKLEDIKFEDLGQAKKVISTDIQTTIVDGYGDKKDVKKRCSQLKGRINSATADYEIESLKERLAKLTGGIAIINVGAPTEVEMKEKKLKVEDAKNATLAAIEEGIISGGGIALLESSKVLDDLQWEGDEQLGVQILKESLVEPIRQILKNASINNDISNLKKGYGYNASNGQLVNMIESGIIDPVKVTRSALQNAVSSSVMLLTTDCIVSCPEPKI